MSALSIGRHSLESPAKLDKGSASKKSNQLFLSHGILESRRSIKSKRSLRKSKLSIPESMKMYSFHHQSSVGNPYSQNQELIMKVKKRLKKT